MKHGLLVIVLSLGLARPALAADDLSKPEAKMKDRVVAVSEGKASPADLKIELMDGSAMSATGLRIYEVTDGHILGQTWESPNSPVTRHEGVTTDGQLQQLLRALIEAKYWTLEGTTFVPDANTFLLRLQAKDLAPVEYRCDAEEYTASPERAAIRAILLTFVGEHP